MVAIFVDVDFWAATTIPTLWPLASRHRGMCSSLRVSSAQFRRLVLPNEPHSKILLRSYDHLYCLAATALIRFVGRNTRR